jgi:hypothetical protein
MDNTRGNRSRYTRANALTAIILALNSQSTFAFQTMAPMNSVSRQRMNIFRSHVSAVQNSSPVVVSAEAEALSHSETTLKL